MQACAAGYALTYVSTLKLQLVSGTVLGLTAAKFKPLIFRRPVFSLSSTIALVRVFVDADACLSAIG
jgi:hypothetical protein